MPELPEVEHARRALEVAAVGRTLAVVACDEDPIVFDKKKAREVERALTGRRVLAAHRRGKYLWLELDEAPHVVLHFGMTGQVRYPDDRPLVYSSSPKVADRTWPPRFTKLHLTFDDGSDLAFTNSRRLGRVLLRDDPPGEKPMLKLGFDPLTDMPDAAAFAKRIGRRKRAVIKALLLDQGFAAGVGNWIADEVLYQAELDPRRRVESLSADEVERLRKKIRHVIVVAVKADARKDELPKSWLFHHRWGKDDDARTSRGEVIEFVDIGGRTTAWVPARQK